MKKKTNTAKKAFKGEFELLKRMTKMCLARFQHIGCEVGIWTF